MSLSVIEALYKRFPVKEYVVLTEVRDAAGHAARRSADAIAMGLWPSRGIELHGIEVKQGRADWLKEVKNPQKAENIFQYCDRFWLLAMEEMVVFSAEEIPRTWGYMQLVGSKLQIIKEAPLLSAKPISKTFLAALLKRATEGMIHPGTINDKLKEAQAEGERLAELAATKELNTLRALKESVDIFEKESGIDLSDTRWNFDPAATAHAIKVITDTGLREYMEKLDKALVTMREQLDNINLKSTKPKDYKNF